MAEYVVKDRSLARPIVSGEPDIEAELTYQQALLNRVQAQANRYTDTAALFQALGGGWWNRNTPEPDTKVGPPRCRPPTPNATPAPKAVVSQR